MNHADVSGSIFAEPVLGKCLVAGALTVLSGERKSGKSTLAIQLAEHALLVDKRSVLFVTEGVSQPVLLDQMACAVARKDWLDFVEGNLSEADQKAVEDVRRTLLERGLSVHTEPHLSDVELAGRVGRWAEAHPGGIVVVDGLQRTDRIAADKFSWRLKGIAEESGAAVVATAALWGPAVGADGEYGGPSAEYADHEWLLLRPWCAAMEIFDRKEASLFVSDRRTGEPQMGLELMLDETLRRFQVVGQVPPSARSLREIRQERPSGMVFHKVLRRGEEAPAGARVVYHAATEMLTEGMMWSETLSEEDLALMRRGF